MALTPVWSWFQENMAVTLMFRLAKYHPRHKLDWFSEAIAIHRKGLLIHVNAAGLRLVRVLALPRKLQPEEA